MQTWKQAQRRALPDISRWNWQGRPRARVDYSFWTTQGWSALGTVRAPGFRAKHSFPGGVSQPLTKNPIVLYGSSEETGRPLHSLKVFSLPHTTPQHQLSLMTLKGFNMELPVQKTAGKEFSVWSFLSGRKLRTSGWWAPTTFLKKNHISFPQTETLQLETMYFCPGAFFLIQRIGVYWAQTWSTPVLELICLDIGSFVIGKIKPDSLLDLFYFLCLVSLALCLLQKNTAYSLKYRE